MPSPFPGMNPYLERPEIWNDFHSRFIPLAAEILTAQVRPHYFVKINENIYVQDAITTDRSSLGRPDLSILPSSVASSAMGTALLAPMSVGMPVIEEDERFGFLELFDRNSRELVTAIELLSPANKETGSKRQMYLAKVSRILESATNFVELDLLRGGPRMPWSRMPSCDYCAVVSRAATRHADPPFAGIWPIGLRDTLPTIPVPLRDNDGDARLDLQALIHRIYESAGYEVFLYTDLPTPRLKPADQAWADEILRSAK